MKKGGCKLQEHDKIDITEDEQNDSFMADESIEKLMIKEFKNIIKICDICGGEMLLEDEETFICQECGYHYKIQ